jgi:hypothetical protein
VDLSLGTGCNFQARTDLSKSVYLILLNTSLAVVSKIVVQNRLGKTTMKNLTFAVSRLTIGIALVLPTSEIDPSKAAQASTFLIASTAGYGVEDCLGEGGECGRVVADAWCEAHGRGAALSFGQQTGPGAALTGSPPYFITCGE